MLKISPANAKTNNLIHVRGLKRWLRGGKRVYSLDLLSGHSCPYAKHCKAMAIKQPDGSTKLKDGPNCLFRCFSASQEVLYPNVYKTREHNLKLIKRAKTTRAIADLILKSLPPRCGILRYHVAGDFFSVSYFRAAILVAQLCPDILFYTYTKNIPALIKMQENIPPNFRVVASYGGTKDHLIPKYKGSAAFVVYSVSEARQMGLPIDHDDRHAAMASGKPFAVLLHGTQPQGSRASQAVFELRKKNIKHSYNRKK